MKQNKILSVLGLATRAGRVKSGEFSTEQAVKSFQAFLVLVAEDASDNTKKMFRNMCSFYEVPLFIHGTKEVLGAAIGKELRASVAVCDQGFADLLTKRLAQEGYHPEIAEETSES
ncbi:MAG: ribosomal L7Ae/L30e/S12e/Gadd45 family protein [Lachnospiraceae bacterium]|nr:ribosomal L7Ae/L30e/S12e/Gadd45 family protein [Lachnospiraceae bacterium]